MKQFDKVTEGMERMQAMMGTELERAAETGKVAESVKGRSSVLPVREKFEGSSSVIPPAI